MRVFLGIFHNFHIRFYCTKRALEKDVFEGSEAKTYCFQMILLFCKFGSSTL